MLTWIFIFKEEFFLSKFKNANDDWYQNYANKDLGSTFIHFLMKIENSEIWKLDNITTQSHFTLKDR